jgi:conjugal transfer ATP-binding protein TraC
MSVTELKSLYWQKLRKPFYQYLNFWTVDTISTSDTSETSVLIGVDLQMSCCFEIEPQDLTLKSDEEIPVFFEQLKNILHSLPENTTLQFLVHNSQNVEKIYSEYVNNTDQSDELAKYVVEKKIEHLKSIKPSVKKYYMFITIYPDDVDLQKMSVNIFAILKPNYKKLAENIHKKYTQKLLQTTETICGMLNSIGVKTKKLNKQQIIELLYQHLNPGRAEILDFDSDNIPPQVTLRSLLTYNAVENAFAYTFVDGYFFRAVNMLSRPRQITFEYINEFLKQIEGEYFLSVCVHSIEQEKIIKQLQFNSTLATIIATINPFKKYHEAELKAQHSAELVEYVKNTFQKLYQLSFCVVLKSPTLELLTQRTNKVLSEFKNIGETEGIIDDMNHMYLWLSCLPNHSHYNLRKHIFHTEAVSEFLPVSKPWGGTKETKMLFLSRDYELIKYDMFDSELPAKHSIIVGSTGAGKSFTTNYLLTNFFIESENNHIVVVDIGGSYRKLCSLFGGEYLEIQLSEEYGFNPFPPKKFVYDETKNELDPDTMSFLLLLVQKLLKKTELTGQETYILEKAITNTYKYLKPQYDTPILSNLHYQLKFYTPEGRPETDNTSDTIDTSDTLDTSISDATKIAKKFAADLEEWTSGQKGKMINRRTSIEPKARMIVFDLQGLQQHKELQSVVLFLIQNVIWQKLYNKQLKKMIVFDECWQLFDDPVAAKLVENLYRTARKFNAAVLSITQSPEDFLNSQSATAVISNSYIKYVLKLQRGFEALKKLDFNEKEIELVKSLQSVRGKYSEIMVKFMNKTQVLRIQTSKTDYWICTTDPEDFKVEQQVRNKYPNITETELLKKLSQEV